MKRSVVLFLGLVVTGCAPSQGVFQTAHTPVPDPKVTFTSLPLMAPATNTVQPFPAFTQTQEVTPSNTATPRPSEIPTETPIPWIYVFPVQPPSAVDFAEGTAGHGYPATDIFALEGTKFVAVINGVIDYVSNEDRWNPEQDDPELRGGLCVAIIGDDGVRYYGSHLSRIENGIKIGGRVGAGQILGYVGHSGDARNTQSHLHFGISHPTTPEDWHTRRGEVDPYPFLVAWRDGHNVTPPLPPP
jgi:murein DD-endopeptidase MepM/ murein hydrolase activator NlpD